MLAAAERPLLILGGSGWDADAVRAIRRFAEDNGLPGGVLVSPASAVRQSRSALRRRLGARPEPRAGRTRSLGPILIVAVGARLSEVPTSGYTLIEAPRPRQRFVHVYGDPDELGRVYQADLAINAGPAPFAQAAAELEPVDATRWAGWTAAARTTTKRGAFRPKRGQRSISSGGGRALARRTAAGRCDPMATAP